MLGRTRSELLASLSRAEEMELMAYAAEFGLPDDPREMIPDPPLKTGETQSADEMEALAAAFAAGHNARMKNAPAANN